MRTTKLSDVYPSPSGRDRGLDRWRPEKEKQIRWNLPPDEALSLPWVRECIGNHPRPFNLIAKATDGRGKALRTWYLRKDDLEVYAELGTCPSEAIYPPSIALGIPTEPALPHLVTLDI